MISPLPDFKPTFELLERYRERTAATLPQRQVLVLREVSYRLSDLAVLAERIQQLRLDTELFYYLAHRYCTCLSLLPV